MAKTMKSVRKTAGAMLPANTHDSAPGGVKTMRRSLFILAALVVAVLTLGVASASAYCGPEFNTKAEAIAYYHTPEGAKRLPSLRNELEKHGFLHADQSIWAFLNSPNVVVVTTPGKYTLSTNTSCNGFKYEPFGGLLGHSHKKVLAVRGKKSVHKLGKKHQVGQPTREVVSVKEVKEPQADGSVNVYKEETLKVTTLYHEKLEVCHSFNPIEKAYCRNFVTGPVFKLCSPTVHTTKTETPETKRTLVRTEPPFKPPVEEPKKPSEEHNCSAISSGATWSPTQNSCVITICGVTVIVNGSGNVINIENEACKVEEEHEEPKCGEHETGKYPECKPEEKEKPKCKPGEKGEPPYCHPPTCEETKTCKCPPGEVGYPKCHPPTCEETETCEKPEAPEIFAPEVNDVERGEGYPNFKVPVKMWGSDTGTMTETSRYSGFGPHGEKPVETFEVKGFEEPTSRYQAPGEIPPKGYDEVTITVTDKQHPSLKATIVVKITITEDAINPSNKIAGAM